MGIFERKRETKANGGKTLVGLWATSAEKEEIRKLAYAAGCDHVSDYFRLILANDRACKARGVVPPGVFEIQVTTAVGDLEPQRVAANDLRNALVQASALPIELWFPEERAEA
jgi:hypothetical protein